jgi:hypothetical protein
MAGPLPIPTFTDLSFIITILHPFNKIISIEGIIHPQVVGEDYYGHLTGTDMG